MTTAPAFTAASLNALAALTQPTTGNISVAVVLVNFADNRATPWSTAQAQSTVSDGLNSFYAEASNNRTSFTVSAFGFYQLTATSTTCSVLPWQSETFALAKAAGVNLDSFNEVMIAFPPVVYSICAWSGIAMSAATLSGIAYPPTIMINDPNLAVRVTAHEIGHELGLNHANSWVCPNGTMIGSGCASEEYGDPFDDMGGGTYGVFEFSSWHKAALGWLDPSEQQTVTASGDYALVADEAAPKSGVKLLRVPLADGSYYAVEIRQPSGQYDRTISPLPTTGTLIRIVPGSFANAKTNLIDGNPSTTSFADAAFQTGQCLVDPVNNLSITTRSAAVGAAVVHVSLGTTACAAAGGASGDGTRPDLVVSATASAARTSVGGTISYTAVVSSKNGVGGTQLHLRAALPNGASLAGSDRGCVQTDTTVDCNLGSLRATDTTQVRVDITFSAAGSASLRFSLSEQESDLDLSDNQTTAALTVKDPSKSATGQPGADPAPKLLARPTIDGSFTVGEKLSASTGHWQGATSYRYGWKRCNADGSHCVKLKTTSHSYLLQAADSGKRITFTVSASNRNGTRQASSFATPVILGLGKHH